MYNIIEHSAIHYSTGQHSTLQYSTVQYNTMQCSIVQYSTIQYSTVQYITVQSPVLLSSLLISTASLYQLFNSPNLIQIKNKTILITSMQFNLLYVYRKDNHNSSNILSDILYLGYQDMVWLLYGELLDPPMSVRCTQVSGIEAAREAALKGK